MIYYGIKLTDSELIEVDITNQCLAKVCGSGLRRVLVNLLIIGLDKRLALSLRI